MLVDARVYYSCQTLSLNQVVAGVDEVLSHVRDDCDLYDGNEVRELLELKSERIRR